MSRHHHSFAQFRAQSQTRSVARQLECYQQSLPPELRDNAGMCTPQAWHISREYLSGEYELDDPLARHLLANSATTDEISWITQYLRGGPGGAVGTSERFGREMQNAAFGPGNILANANTLRTAGMASVHTRTGNSVLAASRAIEAGQARKVRINAHMSVYNANKSGHGKPRPRVYLSSLPVNVVSPALGTDLRTGASGFSQSLRPTDGKLADRLGNLSAQTHPVGRPAVLNGRLGSGVLTFAPSAAIDLYNNIVSDVHGHRKINWNGFAVASARSQSGNLVGMMGGFVATAIVGGIAGSAAVVGAPLIVFGLLGGLFLQISWNSFGGADWAGDVAESTLKR